METPLHEGAEVDTAQPSAVCLEPTGGAIRLVVANSWDGIPVTADERVSLRISGFGEFLLLEVEAQFYGDPAPPGPVGSTPGLWEFEVVELFICGPGEQYSEFEVGPLGHFLVLRMDGVRNPVEQGLDLQVETAVTGDRWRGRVMISRRLLPDGPHRLNAYAIHGEGEGRRYLAAVPVPGDGPDFHRLEAFASVVLP